MSTSSTFHQLSLAVWLALELNSNFCSMPSSHVQNQFQDFFSDLKFMASLECKEFTGTLVQKVRTHKMTANKQGLMFNVPTHGY